MCRAMKPACTAYLVLLFTVIFSTVNTATAVAGNRPVMLTMSLSMPDNARIFGLRIGGSVSPSLGIAGSYLMVVPEDSDVRLFELGFGLDLMILSMRRGSPFNISLLGQSSLMLSSGLPRDVLLIGGSVTGGITLGRTTLVSDRVAFGYSLGPRWNSSVTSIYVNNTVVQEEKSHQTLLAATINVILIDFLAIALEGTFGEDLVNPGVAITLFQRLTMKFDVARCNGRDIPTVAIGVISG